MEKETDKVKELCEFIWHLEEKYDLFNLCIQDVYIWEYIRMQFYYNLAVSIGILTPQTKIKSKLNRIIFFIKGFRNILSNNFWTLKEYDLIFFSHSRSVKVDDEYIDIYTEYLIKEMNRNQSIVDFEADYQGMHVRKRKHDTHILDWIIQLVYIKSFLTRNNKTLNQNDTDLIKLLESEIFAQYGISYSLSELVQNKVRLFNIYYSIYFKVFKKVKPSKAYLTTAYYYAPIIKAAKDLSIEVVELQHGIITKYHLGYSFPLLKFPLRYFPDKMIVWSEMWKNIIKYPIEESNVIVDRFRYLEEEKRAFNNLNKINNTCLILSQAAISDKIADKILENIDFFEGKHIFYKLHPGEFKIWKENSSLIKLKELLNIEIVSNQKHLYYLMAICEFQVGAFSTALYEGLEFNCKTILLNVDGLGYMEDFIRVNHPIILK